MRHSRARLVAALAAIAAVIPIIAPTGATAAQLRNGQLPASELAPIYNPQASIHNQLRKPAAAAWNSMCLCALREHHPLYSAGALSSYRTYAQQELLRAFWCNRGRCINAALPGTSNHGWGLAIDLGNVPAMRPYIDAHGAHFGWQKRWSDAPWEAWHLRWRAGVWFTHPDPGPDPLRPRLRVGSGGRCQAYFVARVQRRVGIHVDGRYGIDTAAAVRAFQAAHGMPADGVVGARTWRALLAKPAPTPAPKPKPKAPATALGIDVSQYQGNINWTAVKKAGVRFAVVKTSEGIDYRDPRWNTDRVHAIRTAGIALGVYHFMRPRAGRDAALEARFAVRTARAGGWNPKTDLPLTADLESTAISGPATVGYLRRFSEETRRLTGRWPLLYTYPGFWNGPMRNATVPHHLRLWIAHYRVKSPLIPTAFHGRWTAWQYDDSARIPGIATHVDVSLLKGGLPALHRLTHP